MGSSAAIHQPPLPEFPPSDVNRDMPHRGVGFDPASGGAPSRAGRVSTGGHPSGLMPNGAMAHSASAGGALQDMGRARQGVNHAASGAPLLSFQAGLPPSPEYTWCGR